MWGIRCAALGVSVGWQWESGTGNGCAVGSVVVVGLLLLLVVGGAVAGGCSPPPLDWVHMGFCIYRGRGGRGSIELHAGSNGGREDVDVGVCVGYGESRYVCMRFAQLMWSESQPHPAKLCWLSGVSHNVTFVYHHLLHVTLEIPPS